MRRRVVAVIGAAAPADEERALALAVGRAIAARGWVLVSGGLGGVMEAASRGAAEAGGLVVGIVPQADPSACNPYVALAIATGMGDARNAVITNTADGFVAVGGSFGTLSEIAYALKRRKPVVGLSTWRLDQSRLRGEPWLEVDSPERAVRALAEALGEAEG